MGVEWCFYIYLSKKNKYNVYNQYILVSMMLVNSVLDPHPMEQTRIKNQINKLRKELASEDLDPSLKANIEKDIAMDGTILEIPPEILSA